MIGPALSVVIPCSRPTVVARGLEGFARQNGNTEFEVIVVGDVEGISKSYDRFRLKLIPCKERHSNVRRNIGISQAGAPLIGFIDDDAVPEQYWVMTAVSLDPTAKMILTGPEKPATSAPTSDLVYAVSQNRYAEGTRSHVNGVREEVSWADVPFCNCIVPRHVFNTVGMPAIDIPWDMDDFEFCMRARRVVRFENVPELAISHDRYPDSVIGFLHYKWRLRIRTGEKLLSHPQLYGRIPAVLGCAILPGAIAVLVLLSSPYVALIGLGGYVTMLVAQSRSAIHWGGMKGVIPYLAVMAALHAVTLVGVQVGMMRGVLRRMKIVKSVVQGVLAPVSTSGMTRRWWFRLWRGRLGAD